MTSSTEGVAAKGGHLVAMNASQIDANMDTEARVLMHDERSCIFETRIERADLCRQRGSTQFQNGAIDQAVKWYERALYHVDFDEATWHFEFTSRNRADVNVVRLPVYMNLAACYLVQGAPDEGDRNDEVLKKAIEKADLALGIDSENKKALYRGGYAALLKGDLKRAKEMLTKAAKNNPKDRKIRDAMATLKAKLLEQKNEEKERWGGKLLEEKQKHVSTTAVQAKQWMKPSEPNYALGTLAFVVLLIVLALGQLRFVE
ncbi:hypothetical protein CCR75_008221 [Bremia lactucae]|uniref:Uncharacterized protein n=1 Tax=Bremia lactucae TaxID=4779 RepID=A0A976IFQ8_BRELC|nr:hypothetical protein CCR75_008221 [Bremia lactucae]